MRLLQTDVFILGAVSAVSACRMDAAPALRDRNERGRGGGGGWWVVGRMVGRWVVGRGRHPYRMIRTRHVSLLRAPLPVSR